jgi:lipoprotein-anchoring transpeptidase ErfK/SrfK
MQLDRRKALTLLSGGAAWLVGTGSVLAQSASRVKFNFKADPWTGREPYKGKKIVKYRSKHRPGTIIISTSERKLYFVLAGGKAIVYGVGVGRAGFSWSGSANIARKAQWPDWRPPKEMIAREKERGREIPVFVEGGINNPLGARALYLYQGGRDTLYRIHGTNAPHTIGLAVSSGCIRMLNDEVIDLYKRVKLGARVVVS